MHEKQYLELSNITVISDASLVPVLSKRATNMLSVLMAHRQHPHIVFQHGGCELEHAYRHTYCKGSILMNMHHGLHSVVRQEGRKMGVVVIYLHLLMLEFHFSMTIDGVSSYSILRTGCIAPCVVLVGREPVH